MGMTLLTVLLNVFLSLPDYYLSSEKTGTLSYSPLYLQCLGLFLGHDACAINIDDVKYRNVQRRRGWGVVSIVICRVKTTPKFSGLRTDTGQPGH